MLTTLRALNDPACALSSVNRVPILGLGGVCHGKVHGWGPVTWLRPLVCALSSVNQHRKTELHLVCHGKVHGWLQKRL